MVVVLVTMVVGGKGLGEAGCMRWEGRWEGGGEGAERGLGCLALGERAG